jgi:hypothetical protein
MTFQYGYNHMNQREILRAGRSIKKMGGGGMVWPLTAMHVQVRAGVREKE